MELIFTLSATQTIQIKMLLNSFKPGEFEDVTSQAQDSNSLPLIACQLFSIFQFSGSINFYASF